jgi:hypothetical protein
MKDKLEKSTQTILGIFAVLMLVIFTIASIGIKYDFTKYVVMISGFFLTFILISEAGVFQYFRSKSYKKITFGDIIIFVSILLAGGVFINSLLMIPQLSAVSPLWLISYAQVSGAIMGLIGLIVAVIYMMTPRVKA